MAEQQSCDAGDAAACTALARQLLRSRKVEDGARAVALLQRACDARDGSACAQLALLYRQGERVAKDVAHAAVLAERACNLEDMPGCIFLGLLAQRGEGVPRDVVRAAALAERACRGKLAFGCIAWSWALRTGVGASKDVAAAAAALEPPCAAGEANACSELAAHHLLVGAGVAQDVERAVSLWQRACREGHARSCARLARAYATGRGVARNDAQAAAYYRSACDKERLPDAQACVALARLQESGRGVPRDLVAAGRSLQRGCTLGSAGACNAVVDGARGNEGDELARADRFLDETCSAKAKGNGAACAAHARLLLESPLAEGGRRRQLALQRDQRACDLDVGGACDRIARSWIALGELDAALPFARKACDHGRCGSLFRVMRETPGAELAHEEAELRRACDDGHASSCNRVAWALIMAERDAEAVALARRSLELDEEQAPTAAPDTLAVALARAGKRDEALAVLDAALLEVPGEETLLQRRAAIVAGRLAVDEVIAPPPYTADELRAAPSVQPGVTPDATQRGEGA